MKIDIVQAELTKKGYVILNNTTGFAYGVDTSKNIFIEQIGKCNIEMVGLICMDNANKIINYSNIAIGNIDTVKVSISQIFKVALLSNATKIIIAHNHPSGVLEITESDIELTKKIGMAAGIFNIDLIDSLIINQMGKVISIREKIKELI